MAVLTLGIVFSLLCLTDAVKGSEIIFTATPSEVKDGLTEKVTLLCSLNDTSPASSIIGRRGVHTQTDDVSTGSDDVTATRRDVSSTTDNVEEVLSIIVTRDNTDIATISHTHPATVADGSTNLVVTGHVSTPPSGRGFLELTWTYPKNDTSGNYRCEVNTLTSGGHSVTFTSSLSLGTVAPSVSDLVSHIRKLEDDSKQSEAERQAAVKRISQLEAENVSGKQKIGQLEAKVSHLDHFETGTIHLGQITSFVSGNGVRVKNVRQDFQQIYDVPPKVVLAHKGIDAHIIRYFPTVLSVDTQGFNMEFKTWSDSHISGWDVNWVSIPA